MTRWLLLLLLLLACDSAGPSGSGAVDVYAMTQGGDVDTDGYMVLVDEARALSVTANGLLSITDLPAGEHVLELQGVADNCTVGGGTVRRLTVEKGVLRIVTFDVECHATGIRVVTSFTGLDPDPVLHIFLNNTLRPEVVAADNDREVTRLAPGSYEVRLGDVSPNCQVEPATRQVTVTLRQVTAARFTGHCIATTGVILVTVRGSGEDVDQSGYSVAVPGVSGVIAPTGEPLVLSGVPPGVHPLRLLDVAQNCAVTGPNPRNVAVAAGSEKRDTVAVTFDVVCSRAWGFAFSRGFTVSLSTPDGGIVEQTAIAGGRPAWSPDGRRLAFTCGLLCVMDLQGNGVTRLSFADLQVDNVAWRSDGLRVIVSLSSCGYAGGYYCTFAGLVLLSPDGDSRVPFAVPADVAWVNGITWSPDRTTIAFGCSFIQGTAPKICSIRSDGSGFRVLTPGPGEDIDPAWSPDGSRIAFASSRYGQMEILLMNPDGTQLTRLSPNAFGREPTWSPDGNRIGYSLLDGIQRGLMLIQADGSGGVRLTRGGEDAYLAWRP